MATPEEFDRSAPEAAVQTKLMRRFAELRSKVEAGEPVDWPAWEERLRKELEDELAAVFLLIFMVMRDDQSRATQLASRFASSRAGTLLDRMRRNFRNEVNSGVPARDVFSPTRAETIAITEITTAISAAENAARQDRAMDDPERRAKEQPDGTPADRPGVGPGDGRLKPPPVIVSDGTVAIWQTAEDERVCPVCGPLHDARATRWATQFPNGPPAHPRCRCWLIYK